MRKFPARKTDRILKIRQECLGTYPYFFFSSPKHLLSPLGILGGLKFCANPKIEMTQSENDQVQTFSEKNG